MSKLLEQAVNSHYLQQSPSPELMQRLITQHQLMAKNKTPALRTQSWKPWLLALAASCVITLATWAWLSPRDITNGGITGHDVAVSVLTYHGYNRQPDFTSAPTLEVSHLNQAMDRLDFQLQLPPQIAEQGLHLHSARYCQVAGHIAAHLYLRDANNQRHSLYVARASQQLQDLAPYATELDAHQVHLWHDGNLFFALVQGQ